MFIHRSSALVIGLLAGLLSSTLFADHREFLLQAPEDGIYHNAYPDFPEFPNRSIDFNRVNSFERLAQKDIVWAVLEDHWFRGIYFPDDRVDAIIAAGKIPMLSIRPWSRVKWGSGEDSYLKFDRFLAGRWDDELKRYARHARDTNTTIMIGFAPEPNGDWFPWSGVFNGAGTSTRYGNPLLADGPEKYRDVYRHIIDIFRDVGADNVNFVFHVVNGNKPNASWNELRAYYPGDSYIDWIGTSVYSAQEAGDVWEDFSETMDDAYSEIIEVSYKKPVAILEWGIIEDRHVPFKKADWIIDAFSSLKDGRYPRIKGITYWHERAWLPSRNNMRLDSSANALRAYREEVADPLFVTRPIIGTRQ